MESWADSRAIRVGSLTFDVAMAGPQTGVPVLFLHGFPESRDQWLPLVPELVSAGVRVIAPNMRGYSQQARPQGVGQYVIDELVGDVLGLLDALSLEQAHLVGHDWGGTVAWFAASRDPKRFLSLTVISTAHPRAVLEAVEYDPAQREALQYIKTFRHPSAEDELRANEWDRLRTLCRDLPRPIFDHHTKLLSEPGALTGALNYYRDYDPATAQELDPLPVPTTYVWGEDDFAFGRMAAENTAKYVSEDYRFVPLAQTGHWICESAPNALIDAMADRIIPRP